MASTNREIIGIARGTNPVPLHRVTASRHVGGLEDLTVDLPLAAARRMRVVLFAAGWLRVSSVEVAP